MLIFDSDYFTILFYLFTGPVKTTTCLNHSYSVPSFKSIKSEAGAILAEMAIVSVNFIKYVN